MQFNLSLTIGFYLTHCAKHQNFTRILLPHRMEDLTVKSYPNFSLNFKHTSSYMVIASNHYMMLLRAIAFNSKFNFECRHTPLYTIAFVFSTSVGLLHSLIFFSASSPMGFQKSPSDFPFIDYARWSWNHSTVIYDCVLGTHSSRVTILLSLT